jgi:hypothetical protein
MFGFCWSSSFETVEHRDSDGSMDFKFLCWVGRHTAFRGRFCGSKIGR